MNSLPPFVTREVGGRPSTVSLKSPDEVRAHCLSGDAKIVLTSRYGRFTYRIQSSDDRISWRVRGFAKRSEGTSRSGRDFRQGHGARFRLIGRIGPDFKFQRDKNSRLLDSEPIVRSFVEFYDLVFIRNSMRPAEVKIEADTL
jgi:hypothetical protein